MPATLEKRLTRVAASTGSGSSRRRRSASASTTTPPNHTAAAQTWAVSAAVASQRGIGRAGVAGGRERAGRQQRAEAGHHPGGRVHEGPAPPWTSSAAPMTARSTERPDTRTEHLVEHARLGDRPDPEAGREDGLDRERRRGPRRCRRAAAAVRSPRVAVRSRSSPNQARTVEPPAASSRPGVGDAAQRRRPRPARTARPAGRAASRAGPRGAGTATRSRRRTRRGSGGCRPR